MAPGPISRRRRPRQWQRVYPTAPDSAWMLGGALALAVEARRDRHLAVDEHAAAEEILDDIADRDEAADHDQAEHIADEDDPGTSDCDADDASDWP